MMYHIVEFTTATPSEYEIVPDIWLSIDDTICVWPPFRSPTMVSKLIQECAKPEEGWKIYQVRSLKRFDTYAAASSCLLKNSGLSNRFPEEENNSRKRQKLNYPKITFQDSDNESSSVTIIPDNPPPENAQNSSNTVSPKVFYIDSLADGQNSSVSDQRIVQLQTCNDTSAEAIGFMHDLTQSQTSAENIDVNINSCTCPLSQSILPLLKNIQKQVEANSRMLQQMLGHEKPPASIIHALPQTFPVTLPVSSYQELKIVDVYLDDDTNFALTIPFFSSLGGNDSKNTLKRILEKLISGELALQMNWKGRGEKEPFHLFSKIHSLIYHAAKRNSKCEDITLMEVEKSIKDWLRFAPERYGGRAKKKESCQLDISSGPTIVVKIEDP